MKKRFKLGSTLLALAMGFVGAGMAPANAAISEQHFIKVSTHGAPTWCADGYLYSASNKLVKKWHECHTRGYALWRWTWRGDAGHVDVYVWGLMDGWGNNPAYIRWRPVNHDYCFLVTSGSKAYYTGSSEDSNCNPR